MEGNLTKGPILKTLMKLAIPIMASSFLGTLYNITDMAWIGLLGAKAVAGVGVGGTIMAVLSSLTGGEYFDFQVKNGEGYETVLEWIQGSWKITSLTKIGCEDSKSEHLQ